jgi:acetoin utilization protein AcuB
MNLRDWMTADPITVGPDEAVPDAFARMKAGRFRRLPVVKDGDLGGIVTDRDLREAMPSDASSLSGWELNFLIARLKVSEVMTRAVVTVREDASLEDAARLMLARRIGGLPVVDARGALRGVVTVTDVLEAFVRTPAASAVS